MKASRAEGYPSHWGVEAGARGRPGGLEGASVGEAALLPVTHHAPLHDRQPCLACAQWEVWGSTVWAVIPHSLLPAANTEVRGWGSQKESKHSGQALVLYRPLKTSLLEAAEQLICPLFFFTETLILVFLARFNFWKRALTESPKDNLLQQTYIAIIWSH